MTDDVQARLAEHNAGRCPYTSRYLPWELVAFVAVKSKKHALELERYFKSGSGYAFAHKHLW
jgi:putative endonuclease